MANRLARDPRLLSPWRPARARWTSTIRTAISSSRPPVVLAGDVREFYGSVTPAALRQVLRRGPGAAADELDRFLRDLAMRAGSGLPAGPAPSAIVANAVLASADEAIAICGVRHLRWVDDIVVFGPDRASVLRTYRRWVQALTELDLAPNESKLRIFDDRDAALTQLAHADPSTDRRTARAIIAPT
jgi:hypothetical protein